MNYVDEIISTFPKRKMNEYEIAKYLKNNKELIILSSYTKCSLEELSGFCVERVWTKNGKNEYGGTYNEYWRISKKEDISNKEKFTIEILKELLDKIDNIEYKSSDDYFWHGVSDAEMKIRHLIEDKIIELMKKEERKNE